MLRDCGAAPAAKQCPDGVFCVALISCDVVQAQRCFERLRIGVSNADSVKNVAYPLSGELNMSIGCASAAFDADVGFSSSHMLFNAGEALCAAMHLGGDRVALSNNSGEVLLRYVAEAKGQPVSMPAPEKKSSVFKLFSRSVGR